MGLPLFSIETPEVRLIWSLAGKPAKPLFPATAAQPFGLSVRALRSGEAPRVCLHTAQETHLYEQTAYMLFVRSKTGKAVRVLHRDPTAAAHLHIAEGGSVVHGMVNFGTQVGGSQFSIALEETLLFSFEVEIFPSKMDYRRDYQIIRDDVQEIAKSLALEYLRAASDRGRLEPQAGSASLGWALRLRHLVDDLEESMRCIAGHPLWDTDRAITQSRLEQVRRPDAAVRRAVMQGKGKGGWQPVAEGFSARAWLSAGKARYTLDTPEHRWLAARFSHLLKRLAAVQQVEKERPEKTRQAQILRELEALEKRVTRMAQTSALREAHAHAPPLVAPDRLQTAPGYRQAYQACLLLEQGLSISGGPIELSLKDLHLLYEYWCLLTVAQVLAEETGLPVPARRLLRVEQHGLRFRLRRGKAQTLRFRFRDGRLALTYNPRFGGEGYLVPQQPDMVLSVHRKGAEPALYVLDAKYRLDASPEYVRRYGAPGPPADALNDLHRYRDALLDDKRRTRPVRQAIALFPWREAAEGAFASGRHWQSIRTVGVGAVPLLPGETNYLRRWVQEILSKEGMSAP